MTTMMMMKTKKNVFINTSFGKLAKTAIILYKIKSIITILSRRLNSQP